MKRYDDKKNLSDDNFLKFKMLICANNIDKYNNSDDEDEYLGYNLNRERKELLIRYYSRYGNNIVPIS